MKYKLWLRVSIFLLAFFFLAQGSLYAQDDQGRQGGNASGRSGPAATWTPNLQARQGSRSGRNMDQYLA